MITFFIVYFALIFQINIADSNCPMSEICRCDKSQNQVVCDGSLGNQSEDINIPSVANLLPVKNYYFSNFKEIQKNAFQNMTFLANESITIHFINITAINSEAFSATMAIPDDSTLSIYIENSNNQASLTLDLHAFNYIKIDRLHFYNIGNFNGQNIFDTHCFGSFLYINELVFEQSNITGFSSSGRKPASVEHLYIRDCPEFKELTSYNVPTFLGVTKTLEISNSGLEFIDHYTFPGWSYVFRELSIKNNPNLKNFSTAIINQFLMDLEKLDLSNNSITSLNDNPDWSSFYHTQYLILTHQKRLDLFIKSDILKNLDFLKLVDLSDGIIGDDDEDLIKNHVDDMPNLSSLNISFTNFTEDMIIDLLTQLSNTANQNLDISLLGHTLNESNFCSYFQVFRNSPNLIRLELDETHECNCVIDLFFDDEHIGLIFNDTLIQPTCLSNTSRSRCNIDSQLVISKCSVGNSGSDNSNHNGDIGNYAFIGVMVGLSVVLIALLALGSSVVLRSKKDLQNSVPVMEDLENDLSVTYPEQGDNSTTVNTQDPVDNPSSVTIEQPNDNWTTDDMEEPLESAL